MRSLGRSEFEGPRASLGLFEAFLSSRARNELHFERAAHVNVHTALWTLPDSGGLLATGRVGASGLRIS
jgi:hypothetical protein